jgi:iron complex outermembrane receptor protein
VGSANAGAALAAAAATPNCFSASSVYPGGYTPYFVNHVTALYGTLGMKGEIVDKLTYDISFGASRYRMDINVDNSLNPSMGSDSPTSFYDGSRIQTEFVGNADVSYPLDVGFATPLNIAAGFEWHKERFQVVEGQPGSYEAGVLASQGFLIGEEAYVGYSPQTAGVWSRSNVSLYLDMETNPIEALNLGAAVRFEDYTDFGSKVTYKFSALYHLTDSLGIRGTMPPASTRPARGSRTIRGSASSSIQTDR